MKSIKKIKLIGAGGIGCYLIEGLARYLNYQSEESYELTIIDGDSYEQKNAQRQKFLNFRNKAEEMVSLNKAYYSKIHFRSKNEYVTKNNVVSLIRENDFVLLCVDNHATRKVVSERCSELNNVTLISGGNDYTDGNVIVYIRKSGKDLNKSPIDLYSSIANPQDNNPGESNLENQGCQSDSIQHPQLVPTNMTAASVMLNCFRLCNIDKFDVSKNQVFFDINSLYQRPSPEQF
jgi:molybdopterin/thiamine biosynthesis adenylyltransferase